MAPLAQLLARAASDLADYDGALRALTAAEATGEACPSVERRGNLLALRARARVRLDALREALAATGHAIEAVPGAEGVEA